MKRQERRGAHPDGDLPDPSRSEEQRPDSAHQTVSHRQIRCPLVRTAQHDQLLLEQEILSDHGSHSTGAAELRSRDRHVEQREQDLFHTRDSVGQTSGATQIWLS